MRVKPITRKRRLIIGVLSAANYVERRDACRRTWVAEAAAHPDVEVVFVLGGGPAIRHAVRVDDLLTVPCSDDYGSLPQKTHGFLKWAVENFDFHVAFKCDDDTYVHFQRLMGYEIGARDYVGADIGGYASGGAGYLLSARAARALLPDLARSDDGPEDVIVGETLRKRGFVLTGSGLFRYDFTPGNHPTPTNQIITSHYVQPEKMIDLHASLTEATPSRSEAPYRILDWETGWGVLGLDGAIGHEVDGATDVQRPEIALDWSAYKLLSGHVNCRIELQIERPVGIFGFMEGHSWNAPEAPVTFSVDDIVSGVLIGPGERTAERRLPAGRCVLRMTTRGEKTRRYPVWAVRELTDTEPTISSAPGAGRGILQLPPPPRAVRLIGSRESHP